MVFFEHFQSSSTHYYNIKVNILKNGKAAAPAQTHYIYNDLQSAKDDEKLFLWFKNDKRAPSNDRLREIRVDLPGSGANCWTIIPAGDLWDEARQIVGMSAAQINDDLITRFTLAKSNPFLSPIFTPSIISKLPITSARI